MNIGKRKLSGTTAILLVALLAIGTVLGAVTILYTLNVPATWNVSTANGLQLLNATTLQQVNAISFTVNQLGTITESFILKNIGTSAVNVTDVIPDSTALYTFTTTFLNSTSTSQNTIPQGGTYAFDITLTDLGMDSSQTYNGNFAYNIASGFNVGSSGDSFGTTTVSYASDSNQYFEFVSDNFNSSSYPLGSTVLYSFTTKNINQSYAVNGITYKLQIYDSSNNLINTVCDGLTVAYWQNSTHYGQFGNGTHMTDVPLMPNQDITIWNSFLAPGPAGTYHLVLTYQSHNAELINVPISWTIQTSIQNGYVAFAAPSPTVSGATQTGQQGTVSFSLTNMYGPASYTYSVTVLDSDNNLIKTIASGSDSVSGVKNYSFNFTMNTGGTLKMVIAITNDHQ